MRRSAVGPQRRRGSNSRRPLATLEEGDCLCISKLDRCGRTMVEVVNRLHDLQSRGIHVRTLDGLLDTRSLGKMAPLVIGLLTGLAECERSMIVEKGPRKASSTAEGQEATLEDDQDSHR